VHVFFLPSAQFFFFPFCTLSFLCELFLSSPICFLPSPLPFWAWTKPEKKNSTNALHPSSLPALARMTSATNQIKEKMNALRKEAEDAQERADIAEGKVKDLENQLRTKDNDIQSYKNKVALLEQVQNPTPPKH